MDEIIAAKRAEVEQRRSRQSLEQLKELVANATGRLKSTRHSRVKAMMERFNKTEAIDMDKVMERVRKVRSGDAVSCKEYNSYLKKAFGNNSKAKAYASEGYKDDLYDVLLEQYERNVNWLEYDADLLVNSTRRFINR